MVTSKKIRTNKGRDRRKDSLFDDLIGKNQEPEAQAWAGVEAEELKDIQYLVDRPAFTDTNDGKGKSFVAQTTLPNWMYRAYVRVMEKSGRVYDVRSDIFRDGLHLGLAVLSIRHGEDIVRISISDYVDEIRQAKEITQEIMDLKEILESTGDDQIAIGLFIKLWSAMERSTGLRQRFYVLNMYKYPVFHKLVKGSGVKWPEDIIESV